MEQRQLGKTDMQVTVLGFGGAEIGFEQASAETVTQLLHSALDAGLNVIDTAECYLQSEELIGQAVASRRKDFYLFTKCGHPEGPSQEDWRLESLLQSIDAASAVCVLTGWTWSSSIAVRKPSCARATSSPPFSVPVNAATPATSAIAGTVRPPLRHRVRPVRHLANLLRQHLRPGVPSN